MEFWIFSVLAICFSGHVICDLGDGAEVVHKWNIVPYEWPNDTVKQQEIDYGTYIPENNAVNGIKVYKNQVYVTVPRLKSGVPSTLNVVVKSTSGNTDEYVLRPYPSWEMQTLGECEALQGVQSMEIDPHTGYMWILDTGKGRQLCCFKNYSSISVGSCDKKNKTFAHLRKIKLFKRFQSLV